MQSDTGDGTRKGDLALLTVDVVGFGMCSASDQDFRQPGRLGTWRYLLKYRSLSLGITTNTRCRFLVSRTFYLFCFSLVYTRFQCLWALRNSSA